MVKATPKPPKSEVHAFMEGCLYKAQNYTSQTDSNWFVLFAIDFKTECLEMGGAPINDSEYQVQITSTNSDTHGIQGSVPRW